MPCGDPRSRSSASFWRFGRALCLFIVPLRSQHRDANRLVGLRRWHRSRERVACAAGVVLRYPQREIDNLFRQERLVVQHVQNAFDLVWRCLSRIQACRWIDDDACDDPLAERHDDACSAWRRSYAVWYSIRQEIEKGNWNGDGDQPHRIKPRLPVRPLRSGGRGPSSCLPTPRAGSSGCEAETPDGTSARASRLGTRRHARAIVRSSRST